MEFPKIVREILGDNFIDLYRYKWHPEKGGEVQVRILYPDITEEVKVGVASKSYCKPKRKTCVLHKNQSNKFFLIKIFVINSLWFKLC